MKKDKDTIPLKEILSGAQLDECASSVVDCKSMKSCMHEVEAGLRKHELDIEKNGYDVGHLSVIIATSLYPKIEKIKNEDKRKS